tara:strand:- start:357 stop:539 length:183 start_codon:yes stop_codon:yes gene_type:complete
MREIESTKDKGLIAGYKPNRLSLYILLLESRRLDELYNVLWKDMKEYKIPEKVHKPKEDK